MFHFHDRVQLNIIGIYGCMGIGGVSLHCAAVKRGFVVSMRRPRWRCAGGTDKTRVASEPLGSYKGEVLVEPSERELHVQ